MRKIDYSLYLVTDSSICKHGLAESVELALAGGVTLLQLREKELNSRDFYQTACQIKTITDKYNVPLIINDRVDIAMAVDAAGVHLGQSDLPANIARKLCPDKLLGVSCKTVNQALLAQQAGADYLGVGAVFPTTTKVITQPTSISTLQAICQAVSLPVVAIGGISLSNLHHLCGTDISGIAVVSAILGSDDIKFTTQTLKQSVADTIIKKKI